MVFFVNFASEIKIGNQHVWGKIWVSKVVINKFSVINLEKKRKKDLNFKFTVPVRCKKDFLLKMTIFFHGGEVAKICAFY